MMGVSHSKPIKQTDEASKALIIEALAGDNTYGFDIDSIYYFQSEDQWVVFEFLKCDHASVRPTTSHPRRYWNKNWRKFASLWRLTQELKATLYLVNYEDQSHALAQGRQEREFQVIRVDDMDPTEQGGITRETPWTCNFERFQKWFRELNARGAK